MNRTAIAESIVRHGIVAIVRAEAGADLLRAIAAIAAGGVRCIEVTMNTPGAAAAIAAAAARFGPDEALIGAGTVLDAGTCAQAIEAGAQYVVSPNTSAAVIEAAHRLGKPALPGAFTPNEIVHARELGGDLIKLFPAALGGLDYLKALRAPLPHIPLVPTGGITPGNLAAFIEAGAAAVGVGANLAGAAAIAAGDFAGIEANARRFAEALARAREAAHG